ncbi:TPA: hypothetical protein KDX79_003444 [Vibrio parahaemolyticus]|nr:hypothetical protein [Vibrio parahaemolyticus]HBH7870666.1 hypothetical protein [Vibrio parahaemolyticus]
MAKTEIYDFIGELAIALYSKKITISLTALNAILDDKGAAYGNNRGLASGVAAAYRHWELKDPVIYHAIAFTFRDKHGNIPWE